MDSEQLIDQLFKKKLTNILDENYSDEHFGVKELTEKIGLSRSQLHRKINTLYNKSTSQIIREYRLKKALKILQNGVATASEIAYEVGFNSPTYFNTTFREFYGYPPGEEKFKKFTSSSNNDLLGKVKQIQTKKYDKKLYKEKSLVIMTFLILIIIASSYYFYTDSKIIDPGINIKITKKSIAILPFKNLSNEEENQYFTDGVMGAILNHLSSIKEFKVISGITMRQYKNSVKTAPEIAKETGAFYLMEGSAQKHKDSIRINIQLIDAKKDEQIWSKHFKRKYENIFALESEISLLIASELKATLSPKEIEQIEKVPTKNLEAYNLYLMGKFFFSQINIQGDNLKKSIRYFKEAIDKDPEFALAYAALSESYLYLASFEEVELSMVNNLAMKSISLDNNIAEAHTVLGAIACWYEWDWKKAEKEYKLAIKNNPNSSSAYINYCFFLFYVKGNFKDAREMIDKAKSLDPLSLNAILRSATLYFYEGNYEKAMNETKKAKELNQIFLWPYWVNFQCYVKQEKNEQAFSELIKSWKLDSVGINNIKPIKIAYEKDGIHGIYKWIIDYDLRLGNNTDGKLGFGWDNTKLYWIAQNNAFLGNKKEAIKYLEIAFNRKSTMLYRIKYDPSFIPLREEPRFLEILHKMNLGDYSNERYLKP